MQGGQLVQMTFLTAIVCHSFVRAASSIAHIFFALVDIIFLLYQARNYKSDLLILLRGGVQWADKLA